MKAKSPDELRAEIERMGWRVDLSGHDGNWCVRAERGSHFWGCFGKTLDEVWSEALEIAQQYGA